MVKHVMRAIRNPLGKSINRKVLDVGRVYGYGDVVLGPLWSERRYSTPGA